MCRFSVNLSQVKRTCLEGHFFYNSRIMLLPFLLRGCTAKHYVQQALSSTRLCINCCNFRGLATSSDRLFLRRTPQRFLNQSRGAKTHKRKPQEDDWKKRNKTVLTYIAAAGVGMIGLSYAAVPLYRLYCQATGLGGTAVAGHNTEQVETMKPVRDRIIKVTFNADTHASIQWNFRPQQSEIYVVPGETALAFYKARNPTDRPVIGISTYNVVPFEAGQYFNKIQCFCFEEQRLNPHEEVDMPVFFYIDPEFDDDPRMARVDNIILSYTFFEAKEGQQLPLPGYS
ncbi:cytochrome c oxidase assembly protein COX11, mitochondrial [Garra rufa]|uniref:cytochrome c oxidase assembly protein COX11, mitochondrial n=1 Tax=Garra rufa TaxID=137080 RepID=UPI003CCEA5AE